METKHLSALFGSLGQETRLEILKLLAPLSKNNGETGMPAGEIAVALATAPPTLSFHLKDMTLRHILIQKRVGREMHYLANLPLILQGLADLVSQLEK
jgi:ArsR family transcriptional regulator, arsenate/arsenite/antimonite-responsive transcriptional repressor